jgi:glycerophosphoryl diester phosphodiesterase
MLDKFPNIIAHRGGLSSHEENTIGAFLHSIENGIKGIEMDIRLARKSKKFFLEHDFFHSPAKRQNLLENLIPKIPKDVFLMVELKTDSWLTDNFANKFNEVFKKYFDPDRTLVISFNPFVLTKLRRINPKMKRGYLCGMAYWLASFKHIFIKKMKPDVFLIHNRLLNKKNVDFGRKHKMAVWSFVPNNPAEWQKALDLKVDGITTDYPMALREYLLKKDF